MGGRGEGFWVLIRVRAVGGVGLTVIEDKGWKVHKGGGLSARGVGGFGGGLRGRKAGDFVAWTRIKRGPTAGREAYPTRRFGVGGRRGVIRNFGHCLGNGLRDGLSAQ